MQSLALSMPLHSPQGSQRVASSLAQQLDAQSMHSLPGQAFSADVAGTSPMAVVSLAAPALQPKEEPNEAQAFAQEAAQLQKFAQNLKVRVREAKQATSGWQLPDLRHACRYKLYVCCILGHLLHQSDTGAAKRYSKQACRLATRSLSISVLTVYLVDCARSKFG